MKGSIESMLNKTLKSTQVKVMICTCFIGERLDPLIVCDEGGIGTDEYEDILYDGLFSLINDILEILKDTKEVQVTNETTFLFIQENASYHKANSILEFLKENYVLIIKWQP